MTNPSQSRVYYNPCQLCQPGPYGALSSAPVCQGHEVQLPPSGGIDVPSIFYGNGYEAGLKAGAADLAAARADAERLASALEGVVCDECGWALVDVPDRTNENCPACQGFYSALRAHKLLKSLEICDHSAGPGEAGIGLESDVRCRGCGKAWEF